MSPGTVSSLLITGTDTGVGKTWISCLLIQHLAASGLQVGAYKPVCSGAVRDPGGIWRWNDVDLLLQACRDYRLSHPSESPGHQAEITLDMVCPQRFIAPVAPTVAARMEQMTVDAAMLKDGLLVWQNLADFIVVEGAGGLLCPLSDHQTVADLAEDLSCPLVIVAANRLGVINHTLLTVGIARSRKLPIKAIILNDITPPSFDHTAACSATESDIADPSRSTNAELLLHWIAELPLFHCPYGLLQLTPLNKLAETCNWAGP